MPYFTTDDNCSLYYEFSGQGPGKSVIVFLNGTLQTTINWKLVTKGFAHQYRILLYDARSQGESSLGSKPLSLKRHAEDLKILLYELNINKAALVGISHGARVALTLAQETPQLISCLVLCSVSAQSTFRAKMVVRSWHEILKRHSLDAMVWAAVPYIFGGRYLKGNAKLMERMVQTIVRRNKQAALPDHLEAMCHYPPMAQFLKAMPFDVLVLTGEDDPLVTCEGAKQIAQTCGGRHIELKGVGHSIPAEAPEAFVQLVGEFLTAC